ncbi:class II aldolase/adducin family protein [Kineosporia sp. R_H_3]|uniref:class II aldolase/adducin family protein n=1 Tax=Kineosporia sp. R_H_3 TaxID=1961848 RepID=UPI000B4ADCEE|nr:class II aldolase/adducin family protein [Kineosporia sp. R_H_3]
MPETADPDDLRELVATGCRVLAAHGASDLIWGHASVRDPGGRGAWLKAAGWGLEEIDAGRVHLVTADGEVAAGDGQRHAEYPIHTEVLLARPDVGAVVHIHPRHAIALAATDQPLRPVSHEANLFGPEPLPRFTRTTDLIVTPGLGRAVAEALGDRNALFLVNHGVVCVGPDLATAVVTAVLLERACEQQLLTVGAGGRPSWTGAEESVRKRDRIYTDQALHQAWDYLVRQLPAR